MPIILIEISSLLTLGLAAYYFVRGSLAKRQMDRIEYTARSIFLLLVSSVPHLTGMVS
jgi:hypothetical protein